VATATVTLPGPEVAERVRSALPDSVSEESEGWVVVEPARLPEVALFLRDDPELDCAYLIAVTGVDRVDHFEVVYHLASLAWNHMIVLKVQALDHEKPEVPSVVPVWPGAHLQEREVYDLMGVRFSGHPDLKRLLLWEGFPGHPLRKDFLGLPGGFKPGLERFPKEFPEGQEGYPHADED
jgi:NADH-quinone oxidoreductase subunit C